MGTVLPANACVQSLKYSILPARMKWWQRGIAGLERSALESTLGVTVGLVSAFDNDQHGRPFSGSTLII